MSAIFKKDSSGDWYNSENGYYLGNHDTYVHLLEVGHPLETIINTIMYGVNNSLSGE
jgi:hypothetical protein